MNPAQKALWFIESHLASELTLDDISGMAGVSRFHMVRAFAAATGFSVMRYVRARRLSEAARALAAGAPDILTLALDADYGSHEAFTRAFRDHFGLTPETVRSLACIDDLKLQEPIQMDSSFTKNLASPRFEISKPLLIAGIGERYNHENGAGIPGQWQRFHQVVDDIPHRVGKVGYGVCCNGDDAGSQFERRSRADGSIRSSDGQLWCLFAEERTRVDRADTKTAVPRASHRLVSNRGVGG